MAKYFFILCSGILLSEILVCLVLPGLTFSNNTWRDVNTILIFTSLFAGIYALLFIKKVHPLIRQSLVILTVVIFSLMASIKIAEDRISSPRGIAILKHALTGEKRVVQVKVVGKSGATIRDTIRVRDF
jgi:hypothetical protein